LRDADLDLAIKGTVNAIFFNHGQCCCAGSRLFVQESIFDKLVGGVADEAKKIKVGPGLDPKTQMGRWFPKASSVEFAAISNLALQKARRPSRAAGSSRARAISSTSSLAGDGRWDMMPSISTPRRRLSAPPCDTVKRCLPPTAIPG